MSGSSYTPLVSDILLAESHCLVQVYLSASRHLQHYISNLHAIPGVFLLFSGLQFYRYYFPVYRFQPRLWPPTYMARVRPHVSRHSRLLTYCRSDVLYRLCHALYRLARLLLPSLSTSVLKGIRSVMPGMCDQSERGSTVYAPPVGRDASNISVCSRSFSGSATIATNRLWNNLDAEMSVGMVTLLYYTRDTPRVGDSNPHNIWQLSHSNGVLLVTKPTWRRIWVRFATNHWRRHLQNVAAII